MAHVDRSYGYGNGRVDPAELRRLLIDQAHRGGPVTYGEVAEAFNEPWHQGFGSSLKKALNSLGDENRWAGEPLPMALVVKDTRLPGNGFYEQIREGTADLERRAELLVIEVECCKSWVW